ncbi:hypothetical protein GGR57DRAFT_26049 [Xylariaceae sp. FL1272]|nr:hypothetical protein GGR57DRAFT_26049 [Xylariaceae sp. FL1272]
MAPNPSAVTGTAASSAPPPDSNEQTPHTKALSRLRSLQPIFKGIAHRNHNQHRRSSWWRSFGMLRRNCDKFMSELQSTISAAQLNAAKAAKAQKALSKKRRRETLAGIEHGELAVEDPVKEDKGFDEKAAAYAIWMRDILIPKCYLAFSQLTADNQFATLGVVLLSALSQVHAVCQLLAPVSSGNLPEERKSSIPETAISQDTNIKQSVETQSELNLQKPGDAAPISGGKAISRDAVELMRKSKKPKALALSTTNHDKSPPSKPQFTPPSKANPTKPSTSSSSSTGTPIKRVPTSQADTESLRPIKKAKTALDSKGKATKGGDAKQSKKKKAKKGDEFDDLFKELV